MPDYYIAADADGFHIWSNQRLESGTTITHPFSTRVAPSELWSFLPVWVDPAETLFGVKPPCRLFHVKPTTKPEDIRRLGMWGALAAEVSEEIDAWQVLGPCGIRVAQYLGMLDKLSDFTAPATPESRAAWNSAGDLTWGTSRFAVKRAVWNAVDEKVPGPGREAARNAGTALVSADLLPAEQFHTLLNPVLDVLGDPDNWPTPDWCFVH